METLVFGEISHTPLVSKINFCRTKRYMQVTHFKTWQFWYSIKKCNIHQQKVLQVKQDVLQKLLFSLKPLSSFA